MTNKPERLTNKNFSEKLSQMKTKYKMLYIGIFGGLMLLGFALLGWEIGIIGAMVVAAIAGFITIWLFNFVLSAKGNDIYYPQYVDKKSK